MANRSDFDKATLPRSLKRIMALAHFDNEHDRGQWKRDMIMAHSYHKRFKNKKRELHVDTSESDG
jgi:hypothetical protein